MKHKNAEIQRILQIMTKYSDFRLKTAICVIEEDGEKIIRLIGEHPGHSLAYRPRNKMLQIVGEQPLCEDEVSLGEQLAKINDLQIDL